MRFLVDEKEAVVDRADSVAQALLAIHDLAPDMVVSDLALEGRGGLELTRQLATHYPDVPVLIVSVHDEDLYAQRALAAGARGYVMKRRSADEVIRAAREVLAGRIYVSEAVRQQMRETGQPDGPLAASPIEALSDRELEVFLLIGRGYAPRHIAEQLSLSVSTVEVYRERLKEKLGLASSPLLLRYAVRWCKDHDLS
jgi:DNA-binding NarL/FixJ family response regulator